MQRQVVLTTSKEEITLDSYMGCWFLFREVLLREEANEDPKSISFRIRDS